MMSPMRSDESYELAFQKVFESYHFSGRGREMPRMLAAAAFDRVRQRRQPIEIIKPAGIRQIVRLKNAPALVF